MVKKIRNNRKKEEKLLRDKKKRKQVKGIKSEIKIKELKENKLNDKEVETEDRENINNENFTEFLQQPVGSSAPVLEKVASADTRNLEQEIATVRSLDSKERKEDTGIDYVADRTDYVSVSDEDTTRQIERNEFQYNRASPNNTMFQEDKESEKTRMIIGKGDTPQGNAERENRFEIERQTFVKSNKDTKKYVNEGDYK